MNLSVGADRRKRILIVAGNVRSLVANRGDLIQSWYARGHDIKALVPSYDFNNAIKSLPIEWKTIALHRASLNPFTDLQTMFEIRMAIRTWRPDIVFSYTAKPVIYGSLAASMEGVSEIYSMITGLGYARTGTGFKQKLSLAMQRVLYRRALQVNKGVFFQNPDDESLFVEEKLIGSSVSRCRINGSGVNLERFHLSLPAPDSPVSFLMIARLLKDKGVQEFVEAARQLQGTGCKFVLVGPHDPTLPAAVSASLVEKWKEEAIVEFVGGVQDVRPYIERCSVFVLPSYREGTPRSVLEAMSMGRAVITTDAPGCRETVVEGENGFLVPVADANALVSAMRRFIQNKDLIHTMGQASRRIAETKYDVHIVNRIISETMGLL